MEIGRRAFLKSLIGALSVPVWYPSRASGAAFVCNPFVQNVGESQATIVWATEEVATCTVGVSVNGMPSGSAQGVVQKFLPADTGLQLPYYQHKALLTGLEPGTEYSYEVIVDGQRRAVGDGLRFRTAGSGRFSFLAFGDSGWGGLEQRTLAELMLRENPSFILHLGDLAYMQGTFQEFQSRYFAVYQDVMQRVPFFPCLGNHEYMTQNGFPHVALHDVPVPEDIPHEDRGRYYSFDWGNVHFVALDSNAPLVQAVQESGPMLQWLENDLRNTQKFWKIVYFHHPPYASGPNQGDGLSELVRHHVVPILERYHVSLVLSGHEHSYQRSYALAGQEIVPDGEGTVYVTSGGGGARLYRCDSSRYGNIRSSEHHYLKVEVDEARLTLCSIGTSGNEIDRLDLTPPPTISDGGVVNAASSLPRFAPGTLISIYGRNLAPETQHSAEVPLPREVLGVSVTADGEPLPLLYVSPMHLNAQLPFELRQGAAVQVRTPNGTYDTSIPILSRSAPGIFVVVHQNGAPVSDESPARPGEFLTVYATGLGAVSGPIVCGSQTPDNPLLTTKADVKVELAGTLLDPAFAGLAPGRIGLYQVDFQVPGQLGGGQHTLSLVVDLSASQAVSLQIAID
ncbi:MAG: metallophosphoesterase [Acidobacteria bacterium]|nr:metallophosphoesterase [Acidobacteriota bacterium]